MHQLDATGERGMFKHSASIWISGYKIQKQILHHFWGYCMIFVQLIDVFLMISISILFLMNTFLWMKLDILGKKYAKLQLKSDK